MEQSRSDAGRGEAEAFGQLIRDRRRNLGLRQDELALVSGVGRRYLIELEAGKPTARLGPALAIAKALGLQMTQLDPEADPGAEYPEF